MDLSIEAIEADLALAEVNIGRPLERLALARAQVRATLRGSSSSTRKPEPEFPPYIIKQDDVDVRILVAEHGEHIVIPNGASFDDRLEVASKLIALPPELLKKILVEAGFEVDFTPKHSAVDFTEAEAVRLGEQAAAIIDAPSPVPEEDPGEIEIDDDDEDFFAEARKERKP